MNDEERHVPVLLAESLRWLAPERGGVFVDCTLGAGGHAEALLAATPAEGAEPLRLVGIDRDPEALALAAERLAPFGDRVVLTEGNFHNLGDVLAQALGEPVPPLAGILADLGVSSMQLDTPERGFSFRFDAPLDMRMGRGGLTAQEIVNTYSEAELENIFREYGDERQARKVARQVVESRRQTPITTTGQLKAVVEEAKGPARPYGRGSRIDPSTRVFQALRIEVNEELSGLNRFLEKAVDMLDAEGRLVVISYHSGEDRIVKHGLRGMARGEKDPVTGRTLAESRLIEVLTKKPVRPGEEEVSANPRSRSARLRAAQRI